MDNETHNTLVPSERVEPKIYAAPRRFDLATMFTVTSAYAVLFALMSLVGWPVGTSVVVAGFVSLVAVAQAVLFSGEYPRTASLACGSGSFLMVGLGVAIWFGQSAPFNTYYVGWPTTFTVLGGGLGYVAGVLVSGVFLVSDSVRQVMKRRRDE